MDIINSIFKRKRVCIPKLTAYGFSQNDDMFSYQTMLPGSGFSMTVEITQEGSVKATIIDTETDEPYTLHLSDSASGSFVGGVKMEYERVLTDIAEECFEPDVFKSTQAKEVITYVREKYGDELEFYGKNFQITQSGAEKTTENGMGQF